ncbi:uroporphyrinogen-III synthase [Gracilibacillus orientalis]|uniref:Uroporphyrinogen-III synthase n=1 Tax=Gracilibacillus orientalis TaxID=334253 RepID=A0A1I4MSD2_9BACI|nr:uroporphyrinogen-III synthase [Gracilibacillus orientalis]SFM05990.1 uroporphyrinogen-III synthase [Gracilibacillus orientalis]
MNQPLKGRKIMVTREAVQALPLIRLLEGYGASCERVPLLRFEAMYNDVNRRQLTNIVPSEWLFFTSVNAVRFFHEYITSLGVQVNNKIAAVGEKTARSLNEYGYTVDFQPSTYSGKTMVEEFLHRNGTKQIALICGENARREIPELLEDAGVSFEKIVIYRTITNEHSKSLLNNMVSEVDAIFFTSPSTVDTFQQFLAPDLFEQAINNMVTVAIGETTANALHELSFRHILYPETFTIENMVEVYIDYIRKGDA